MPGHPHLLSGLVPRVAADRPDDVAATCDRESLTWSELEGRIGRLASVLAQHGVGPGDRVAIYLHKSIESLVAVHGILRAGAAYVPIDPMAPTETVAAIVDDCRVAAIVTHEPRRAGVTRLAADRPLPLVVGLDGPVEGTDGGGSAPTIVPWDRVDSVEPIEPVPVLADDLANGI